MFKGTATAIITPFNDDLSVDFVALSKFVKYQLEGGVDSLIALGTTGEAPTIDKNERERIVSEVVELTDKKVPVIVGTGSLDTKKVVEYNSLAEKCGADGLLIVNPYYNKGTQSSIIEHYKYISERTSLPIILYNVPSRTGMNMLPETVLEIHNTCKNVVAIKEASSDIAQIAKLIAMKPASFSVLSGNDDQALPVMAMGGDGVISTFSNVFPAVMVKITSAMLSGDLAAARIVHNKYLEFMHQLFLESNPVPLKYALSCLGFCKNILRLPLIPASARTMQILKNSIEKLK